MSTEHLKSRPQRHEQFFLFYLNLKPYPNQVVLIFGCFWLTKPAWVKEKTVNFCTTQVFRPDADATRLFLEICSGLREGKTGQRCRWWLFTKSTQT